MALDGGQAMDRASDARVLDLLERALDCSDASARTDLLDTECGDDPDLRHRIERLLAIDASGSPLVRTEVAGLTRAPAFPLPDRIGPFALREILGEGGMGTVVRAERVDGLFEQTVAIKFLRGDLAGASERRLFDAERKALARLDHPGIARILDGGTVAERPYLIMEYVQGEDLAAWLARRPHDAAERLAMFGRIAAAVAHAHRSLVVHADIKPGNLIVTADDGIKLLDFGIARLLDGLEGGDAPHALTRSHAAPERLAGGPPSVSADVYSLGVLLRDMAGNDRPDPDLAAIIARATAPAAAQRYADVAALGADLEARAADRPVSARQPAPWWYAPARFARRHRSGLAATAATILLLTAATITTSRAYVRAERARAVADERFEDVRGTARYLLFDLLARLENRPNALALRSEVAGVAQHYLDRLASGTAAPPAVRLEAAEGLIALANYQARSGWPNLGQPERGAANLARAEAILARLPGERPARLLARARIARAMIAAEMQVDLGRAERLLALADSTPLPNGTRDVALASDRAVALTTLRIWQGRNAEARRHALRGLALPPLPGPRVNVLRRAQLLELGGDAAYYAGDLTGSIRLYRQAVQRLQAAYDAAPDDNYLAWRVARALWNLGTAYADRKDHGRATAALATAYPLAQRAAAFDPRDRSTVRGARVVRTAYGQTLALSGRLDEGLAILRRELAADKAAFRAKPRSVEAARDYAYTMTVFGEAYAANGRLHEACAADRRALGLYDDLARSGRYTAWDSGHNVKLVKQRLARCPAQAASA